MTASIDQQFVEFIVMSIVSKPDKISIERTIDEKGVLLELTVDPEDLGRVIGKRGATAQSLRTLLRALGTKNDARYNLKIVDNGEPRPERAPRNESDNESSRSDAGDSSPVESPDASEEKTTPEDTYESHESDVVSKTRKELDDLDDLDI